MMQVRAGSGQSGGGKGATYKRDRVMGSYSTPSMCLIDMVLVD